MSSSLTAIDTIESGCKNITAYYKDQIIGLVKRLSWSSFCNQTTRGITHTGHLEWKQFDIEPLINKTTPLFFDGPDMYDDLRPESEYQYSKYQYPDQIPPFDICVVFTNGTERWLYGVELLNKGCKGVSVDDVVSEDLYEFIAADIK